MGTRGLYCIWLKYRCVKAEQINGDAYPEHWGYSLFRDLQRVEFRQDEQALAETSLAELEGRYDHIHDGYGADEPLPTPLEIEEQLQGAMTFINDEIFCAWVYVVDLDDGVLEVYQGSASGAKTKDHRFGNVGNELDTVPKLVKAFEIRSLAEMRGVQFLNEVFEACEDYEPSLTTSIHAYD